MRVRFAILLGSMLFIPMAFGQATGNDFPDTPRNHWVYESIADLQSEGIIIGYPDGLGRFERGFTRYEMAVVVYSACIQFHKVAKDSSKQNPSDYSGKLRVGTKLISLLENFRTELNNIGAVPNDMAATLRMDILTIGAHQLKDKQFPLPFRDVKPSHWASEAVRNLWVEGIVRGYPDGKFGG